MSARIEPPCQHVLAEHTQAKRRRLLALLPWAAHLNNQTFHKQNSSLARTQQAQDAIETKSSDGLASVETNAHTSHAEHRVDISAVLQMRPLVF